MIGDVSLVGPPGSTQLGGQDLYQLLVRVRGLLVVYAPMQVADAAVEDLTAVIDALKDIRRNMTWQDP